MDSKIRTLQKEESNLARLAGRALGAISCLALIATCIFLLSTGKPESAVYPAMCAGVIGFLIMRPGKRSIRISGGGVVVDVVSDDTGVIKTGVDAVVGHITQEISEKTVQQAIKESQNVE